MKFARLSLLLTVSVLAVGLSSAVAREAKLPFPQDELRSIIQQAEGGDAMAQMRLSFLHQHGIGVPRDTEATLAWMRRAAESGNPVAQWILGLKLALGWAGTEKRPVEARAWLERAADQGHSPAASSLAVLLRFGDGLPAEPEVSAAWARKAAEAGEADAQHALAERYYHGEGGIKKDLVSAYVWAVVARANGYYPLAALSSDITPETISRELSPEQVKQGDVLARDLARTFRQ